MSQFECKVVRIEAVNQHPNADRLKLVKIAGFNCISGDFEDGTSQYKAGDLAVYIPEGAVLTEEVLRYNGFWDSEKGKGMLAGTHGNRVKAIKLRGMVSQGILHPVKTRSCEEPADGTLYRESRDSDGILFNPNTNDVLFVNVGDDVAEALKITKYVPEIPASMSGEVFHLGSEYTLNYDIENIQKHPNVLSINAPVIITEKLHGTFCALGYDPRLNDSRLLEGKFFAFSKGVGADGLVFQNSEKNIASNVYQKMLHKMLPTFKEFLSTFEKSFGIIMCGEIYGRGIQDLQYGESEARFRVFDIYLRNAPAHEEVTEGYVDANELAYANLYHQENKWEFVPELYRGPFSFETLALYRDGKTTINGGANIREGIVIRPFTEDAHEEIGRVILKAVSPDYLLRKGDNTTEFN